MIRRRAAAVALGVALAAGAGRPDQAREAVRDANARARAAYDAKDHPGFLEWSRRLVEAAPHSTRALYNLACAHALLGQWRESVALLDRLTAMEVATAAARDTDFDAIRARPEFAAALQRARALEARVGAGEVAFTLPEKDLLAEGVAHDPRTGAFFVSSVRKHKVVRRDARGAVSDFTSPADGLLSVLALGVDPPRRALWLTTAGKGLMEGHRAGDEKRSWLVEYGIDDARLRRRIEPPAGVPGAQLADLAVAGDGTVYVADPESGGVYVLRRGAAVLEVLVAPGAIGSAQGMAPSPDGRALYVADYVQGIVRVDTRSGAARLLDAPPRAALTGIDGLVLVEGRPPSLVGIQNGIRPHRVVHIALDAGGGRIRGVKTLERNHPQFDEPTLGTRAGDSVYYVANSQYERFRADGTVDAEGLRPPAILRLRLR
jgi:sugar lactone lactonase YvrE